MTTPTINDLVRCAAHELKLREACYPKWVASGRMKDDEAARELAMMRAILERLIAERDGKEADTILA